jgi:hypothetical protein
MRKGSTKKPVELKTEDLIALPENTTMRFIEMSATMSILLRICDACHEMDNRTEPWAGIRKDIERLK